MSQSQSGSVKRIWYAGYGSNLSRSRFMCYIAGGRAPGSRNADPGCRDKTPPLDDKPISLDFEFYFAHYLEDWGGATAYLRRSQSAVALGRMYLIGDDQFNDVVAQENSKPVDGTRVLPSFEELLAGREYALPGNPLYGALRRVDVQSEYPVWTFTTNRNLQINTPGESYVKVIAAGLKETYPSMTHQEICEYLAHAEGVKDRIATNVLAVWVRDAG